jgi:hypothetical protein
MPRLADGALAKSFRWRRGSAVTLRNSLKVGVKPADMRAIREELEFLDSGSSIAVDGGMQNLRLRGKWNRKGIDVLR